MGMLSTTGSNKELLVNCSLQKITDPLKTLVSLQGIFNTDVFKNGHESWKFTINDHNLFCISTDKKGLYEMVIKNGGYIVLYDSDTRIIKVNLSGETIIEVLKNFDFALTSCSLCKIIAYEKNNGDKKKFEFTIKKEKKGIRRICITVENFNG
jgi:hypothetical protein